MELRSLDTYAVSLASLYYKHMMVVNDDTSAVSKWSSKFIDNTRVVSYDHNVFVIQATGLIFEISQWQ